MESAPEPTDELATMVAADETLHWHGHPDRRSLVTGYLLGAIPLLLFLGPMVFIPVAFAVFMIGIAIDAGAVYLVGGLLFAGGVSLAVVFGGAYWVARRVLDHAEYAVTDRRLIRFGGIVGRDYSTVDWANVEDFEVTVGFVDGRYGTGSIAAITAGRGGVTFAAIRDPYDVLATFESIRQGGRP